MTLIIKFLIGNNYTTLDYNRDRLNYSSNHDPHKQCRTLINREIPVKLSLFSQIVTLFSNCHIILWQFGGKKWQFVNCHIWDKFSHLAQILTFGGNSHIWAKLSHLGEILTFWTYEGWHDDVLVYDLYLQLCLPESLVHTKQ